MKSVAPHAFVHAEVAAGFLFHADRCFECGSSCVVLHLGLLRLLTDVRIDVKQSPCVSGDEEVTKHSLEWELVSKCQPYILEFHNHSFVWSTVSVPRRL